MKRTVPVFLLLSLLLAGCWDNQELEESAFIQGIGFNKADHQIKYSVEIIKPEGEQQESSGGKSNGQNLILEKKAGTILELSRGLILISKRRSDFGHTRTFIIGEDLAKEANFPSVLDLIRRDQMFRLNGYAFITDKEPSKIFMTPTLYKNLTSSELISVIEQTKFISEYIPINVFEFFRFLNDHHFNAYMPIITIQKSGNQKVTAISGTAVFKDNKMAGKLNIKESAGLNWLLDMVKGGSLTAMFQTPERVSIEIIKAKTKTKPYLDGNQLKVDIQTKIKATLADNMTSETPNKAFLKKVETTMDHEVEGLMLSSLNKLRKLKADITDCGVILHRNDPKEWARVQSKWDDIFANADVKIDVDVDIVHQGLINRSHNFSNRKKPLNNPYRFIYSLFGR